MKTAEIAADAADIDDQYEALFRRDPMGNAPVDVIVMGVPDATRGEAVGSACVSTLRGLGREAAWRAASAGPIGGLGIALAEAIGSTTRPLILLVGDAVGWTPGHLKPLLRAIDASDHVIGRRPATGIEALTRRAAWLRGKVLYGVPTLDLRSPVRLHRRAALEAIPLQSESEFLNVEVLAKATFLAHLIDEVPIPALEGPGGLGNRALARFDAVELFRRPVFARDAPIGRTRSRGRDAPEGTP